MFSFNATFLIKSIIFLKKKGKKKEMKSTDPILTLFLIFKKAKTTKQGTQMCSSSHSWTAKKLKAYYKFKTTLRVTAPKTYTFLYDII